MQLNNNIVDKLGAEYGQDISIQVATFFATNGVLIRLLFSYILFIFLILIILNIKSKFKWQKYLLFMVAVNVSLAVFFQNFFFFMSFLLLFFVILILTVGENLQKTLHLINLQKVEKSKYKNLYNHITISNKKFKNIQEAFEYDFRNGLLYLYQKIDNFVENIIKWYYINVIIWGIIIIILIILLYKFYLGSEYFIK